MVRNRIVLAAMAVCILASAAQAQQIVRGYPPAYPPPYPPSVREYPREEIYLGHSHVDGPVDHDNIRGAGYFDSPPEIDPPVIQ